MKLMSAKKIIMGGAMALVVALASVAGFAQQTQGTQGQEGQGREGREWHGRKGFGRRGGPGGGGGGLGLFHGRLAEKLNLTDAQKAQLQQIAARYHESFKAARQERRGERAGGFDLLNGGTFNESAVRAAAQARANQRVEMEVARARMMFEMYNVLTAEQKAQLAAERQQWEQKRQERRARRQATPGAIQ